MIVIREASAQLSDHKASLWACTPKGTKWKVCRLEDEVDSSFCSLRKSWCSANHVQRCSVCHIPCFQIDNHRNITPNKISLPIRCINSSASLEMPLVASFKWQVKNLLMALHISISYTLEEEISDRRQKFGREVKKESCYLSYQRAKYLYPSCWS